jgi:CHAP domain
MKGAHLRRRFSLSDYCLMALAACLFIIGAWHMAVDANPDGRVSSLTVKNTTTTTALINSSAIEPETTTTVEPTTTTTAPSAPRKAPRVSKNAVASVALPSSTTTTTESPKTPLEVAQSQVGKTGSYADDGFWCAKFVSWTAELAKIENWESSDSPARLYQLAKDDGRLISEPYPGVMVFIDLTGRNFANQYISHVGIVESVNGDELVIIQGNGNPDPSVVTRKTYKIGDGFVIGFAEFEARS